jgi:hypothetical protein
MNGRTCFSAKVQCFCQFIRETQMTAKLGVSSEKLPHKDIIIQDFA